MKKNKIKKKVKKLLKLTWTYILIPDGDGWFVAVEELPGCMSQGDSLEDAYDMIQDAMKGWLTIALEDGEPFDRYDESKPLWR